MDMHVHFVALYQHLIWKGINATIICKAISFLSGRFQSYARHLRTRLGLKGGVDPPFQILGAYSTYGRRAEERSLYRSRHLGQ